MISLARTDAVVVPSPAESFVLLATYVLREKCMYDNELQWLGGHARKKNAREHNAHFTNQCSTSILHRISKLDSTSNGNSIIYHFWGTKLIEDNIPAYRYQRDGNKAGHETP
jgi:hypothetical protein